MPYRLNYLIEVLNRRPPIAECTDAWCTRRILLRTSLLTIFGLPILHPVISAQEKEYSEYEVKAALMLKLFKFTSWPERAYYRTRDEFQIGILGDDPFGTILDKAIKNQEIEQLPISVVRANDITELLRCDAIFIADAAQSTIRAAREALRKEPVLTIGDQDGMALEGTMMNLLLKEKKVIFEINYAAIRNANLDLNAQVLKLAVLVETAAPEPSTTITE